MLLRVSSIIAAFPPRHVASPPPCLSHSDIVQSPEKPDLRLPTDIDNIEDIQQAISFGNVTASDLCAAYIDR
jgi:hypothetical protein